MKFLTESIIVNDRLNPKLFNEDLSLKEEILDQLTKIADKFVENLEKAGIPIRVIDYWLLGSNAAYNYTDSSDIDLHIIADTSSITADTKLLKLLYEYFKSSFNNKYDIVVKGHEVELYIEDVDSVAVSNGVYSLFNDEWVKVPTKPDVKDIDVESSELYQLMLKRFNTESDAQMLLDDLYILRKSSLANEGEFGIGNLVFKAFRNNGYIQELKDKVVAEENKQLSLEKLEESLLAETYRGQTELRQVIVSLLNVVCGTHLKDTDYVIHHKDGEHDNMSVKNIALFKGDKQTSDNLTQGKSRSASGSHSAYHAQARTSEIQTNGLDYWIDKVVENIDNYTIIDVYRSMTNKQIVLYSSDLFRRDMNAAKKHGIGYIR